MHLLRRIRSRSGRSAGRDTLRQVGPAAMRGDRPLTSWRPPGGQKGSHPGHWELSLVGAVQCRDQRGELPLRDELQFVDEQNYGGLLPGGGLPRPPIIHSGRYSGHRCRRGSFPGASSSGTSMSPCFIFSAEAKPAGAQRALRTPAVGLNGMENQELWRNPQHPTTARYGMKRRSAARGRVEPKH